MPSSRHDEARGRNRGLRILTNVHSAVCLRRRPPRRTLLEVPSLPDSPPTSSRSFVVVAFVADANHILQPKLPTRCPHAKPNDPPCCVGIDYLRHRKTGPRHPLPVFRCSTHPRPRFTGYSPGFAPYQRQPLIPCATSGGLLRDAERGEVNLEDTLLHASRDAAKGERWPAEGPTLAAPACRRTQGRHLDLSERLLGLLPSQDDDLRQHIATALQVDGLSLRDAAASRGRCWSTRGKAIAQVLDELTVNDGLLDRLMAAGHMAGLWPAAQRWDRDNCCHQARPASSPRNRRVRDGPDLGQRPAHEETPP